MMNNKIMALVVMVVFTVLNLKADVKDDYDEFKRQAEKEFKAFRANAEAEYDDFRRKANEEYASFMAKPWKSMEVKPKKQAPVQPEPPKPVYRDIDTVKPAAPRPVVISEVVPIPAPAPVPTPVEPIHEIVEETKPEMFRIKFYGTDIELRKPEIAPFTASGRRGSDYARGWKALNTPATNNLINDCLKVRDERQLCDWAYLKMLLKVAETLYPDDRNKSALLAGFLYCQSGYKMRFALDSASRLHLMFASTGIVYGSPSITTGGASYYLLPGESAPSGGLEVCDFSFPKEQALSFEIRHPMKLDYAPGKVRDIEAQYHPEVKTSVCVNQNLIDFYNDYPEATVSKSPYTKWTVYGNAPASEEFRKQLYPALRDAIGGKTQKEAGDILIHLAESFPYGYDSQIWGRDRAFFADESWNYPLSDCEDHAVNFTRMVRDLMGLDAVLLYYPNHIASAVAFTDGSVTGDYIMHGGKRYVVCDPTIFYSNVGETMRGMDNSSAVVIELSR